MLKGSCSVMKKSSILNILLILSSFFILLFLIKSSFYPYTLIKNIELYNKYYNSNSNSDGVKINFSEDAKNVLRDVEILFKVKLHKQSAYQNIFQTDDINSGIRLELSEMGDAALLISDGTDTGFIGYSLNTKIIADRYYNLKIQIFKNKRICVEVNDNVKLDVLNEKIKFKLNNIVIGTGFDGKRNLFGEIDDFGIKYISYSTKCNNSYKYLFPIFLVILLIFLGNISKEQTKEQLLAKISTIIIMGISFSAMYHYWKVFYQQMSYPYSTFLFIPADRFNDFYVLYNIDKYLNPYFGNMASAQYPLLNVMAYLFSQFQRDISYLVFVIIALIPIVVIVQKYCKNNDNNYDVLNVFALTLLTYPMLFVLDRGNYEVLLLMFLMCFVYLYKKKKYTIASISLSIGIAMKMFPVVFLVLFLKQRKYKYIGIVIITSLLLTLLPMCIFKGGFINNLLYIVDGNNFGSLSTYLGNNQTVQRGVSLFTFIKIGIIQLNMLDFVDFVKLLSIYKYTVTIMFVLLVLYIWKYEDEMWKIVTLLVFSMLMFPHISADYKLIHILIPILLFISKETKNRSDLFYAVLFAILLIPKDYYYFKNIVSDSSTNDISIAVVLNIFIMFVITLTIICESLSNKVRSLYAKV